MRYTFIIIQHSQSLHHSSDQSLTVLMRSSLSPYHIRYTLFVFSPAVDTTDSPWPEAVQLRDAPVDSITKAFMGIVFRIPQHRHNRQRPVRTWPLQPPHLHPLL